MAGMLSTTQAKPNGGKITESSLKSQMHLTPQQSSQLDRIVLAGKKVMFSKQSHQMMLRELEGPGTLAQKLGQGVAGLMALLWQESKQSLPPQLLIPGGMILVTVAADFLRQAGQSVTDQDIGQGIEAMVTALLHASGADPDKVAEIGGGKAKANDITAAPDAAAAAPQPGAMP